MAVLTIIATNNVAGIFTGGRTAVMTGSASALHLVVIDTPHRRPGRFEMTVLTLTGGAYMVRRYRCRFDQPGLRVTAGALPRGALKHTPSMAPATINITMRTFQRPASREVVETGVERCLRVCNRHSSKTQQKYQDTMA